MTKYSDCNQYGSVKARDAINRRLYKGLIIVKRAIYRVFAISDVSLKNLIRNRAGFLGRLLAGRKKRSFSAELIANICIFPNRSNAESILFSRLWRSWRIPRVFARAWVCQTSSLLANHKMSREYCRGRSLNNCSIRLKPRTPAI